MAFSRRLGVIGIVGASWLVALGCDDDEDIVSPMAGAGEAGEAPSGGKSPTAGSQNNGGKAGASAGNGGEGGNGVSGAGGAGGDSGNGAMPSDAGAAGQAGQAGAAGASGGQSPGGAGAGGMGGGGEAGSGGDGGTPSAVAASCSFSCANDDACVIAPNNTTYKCNVVSHRCEDPATACTSDGDCLVAQSSWFVNCVDDDGCDPDFEACVAANGVGWCATLTADPDPDLACFGGTPRTLPRFGSAGTVEVCASADPRCMGGQCNFGCGDPDHGCGAGNGDTCSATTGLCECSSGTECTKTGVCGSDGHCTECSNDGQCAATVDLTGLGVCVAGKCGCASPTTCVNPGYATATATCQ